MKKIFLLLVLGVAFSGCSHKSIKSLQGHCDKVQSGDDLNACDPYPLK